MGRVIKSKLRTLLIMEMLLAKSDEDHRISTGELMDMLKANDISSDRKSIYSDIETLTEWGMDILYNKEKPAGYYVGSRDFELPELKLLVDAVQVSKFVTHKKSRELIGKLEKLTSSPQAGQLHRSVLVTGRNKSVNEQVFYNVNSIHEAINENRQIEFTYHEWNLEKELVPRKDGARYVSSPWVLTWDDENYYLIGYDGKEKKVKHYRVDKMKDITLSKQARQGESEFKDFDMAGYSRQTFGMFGGETENVTLECRNELIGVILDRFGTDNIIVPVGDDRFQIQQKVNVSGQFFGWLVGLGPGVRIVHPPSVAQSFRERLEQMIARSEED